MNPVQDNALNTSSSSQKPVATAGSSPAGILVKTGISKEQEASAVIPSEALSEVSSEIEMAQEVEQAGVKKIGETIELPPDVKKLGVTPSVPAVTSTALPSVVLPISDQKVIQGLHIEMANALRWLAVWCIKRLKKAHIALKAVHGKIIRVKTK